jgi:hypothetical protein
MREPTSNFARPRASEVMRGGSSLHRTFLAASQPGDHVKEVM